MYITDIETDQGQKFRSYFMFFIPFLSNVDFSIIAKVICNRKDHLMVII